MVILWNQVNVFWWVGLPWQWIENTLKLWRWILIIERLLPWVICYMPPREITTFHTVEKWRNILKSESNTCHKHIIFNIRFFQRLYLVEWFRLEKLYVRKCHVHVSHLMTTVFCVNPHVCENESRVLFNDILLHVTYVNNVQINTSYAFKRSQLY